MITHTGNTYCNELKQIDLSLAPMPGTDGGLPLFILDDYAVVRSERDRTHARLNDDKGDILLRGSVLLPKSAQRSEGECGELGKLMVASALLP